MAVIATVSKVCPPGLVYLVPGRLGIKMGDFYTPRTEEIFIDVMPTGVEIAEVMRPTVRMKLLEPAGCVFELPNVNLLNGMNYSHPSNDKTQIVCMFEYPPDAPKPSPINRNNSKSFHFPITGRDGRDVKVEIVVMGEPVRVIADSCHWTVEGLAPDTTNTPGQPLDAIV